MEIVLAFGLLSLAAVLPMTVGRRLVRVGDPWAVVVFGWSALAAIAVGFVVVLGAAVASSTSRVGDLPGLVDQCLAAVGQIWEHPLRHWPRIAAAVLLLLVVGRLAYALIRTFAAARREAARAFSLATGRRAEGPVQLHVVPSDRSFAFAAGIWRRGIVVSDGLLTSLEPQALHAVVAHEQAHLSSWHVASLLFARGVARAFPFISPVKEAADQLELGLEMHADRAAVGATSDPLVVARALVDVAERAGGVPETVLAATGRALEVRIGRLTAQGSRHPKVPHLVILSLTLLLLAALLSLFPVSARTLTGRDRATALHGVCHLPHPSQAQTL